MYNVQEKQRKANEGCVLCERSKRLTGKKAVW